MSTETRNSYDVAREQIIQLQRWAGVQPTRHTELLKKLYQVRAELERLSSVHEAVKIA